MKMFCVRLMVLFLLVLSAYKPTLAQNNAGDKPILFQHFYYPIDVPPAGSSWWREAAKQTSVLARLGVTHLWHPIPVKGGSGALSMGYDPYDLYDLGSKKQKGTVPTRFGTRDEYLAYIATAHANNLSIVADVVLNHGGGADRAEENPIMARLGLDDIPDDSKVPLVNRPLGYSPGMNLRSWTRFLPVGADGQQGTGRFPRYFWHFHPSARTPDRKPPYHSREFLEDYDQTAENGYVGTELIRWANWFRAHSDVDGFRLDAVKHVEPDYVSKFVREVMAASPNRLRKPKPNFFVVAELWSGTPEIAAYANATGRQMRFFDFPLYYALRDMTNDPAKFSMRTLWERRYPNREEAVTFVGNHDTDKEPGPIDRQKRILPYAMILAMSGVPSVFHLDYFRAQDANLPTTLEFLVPIARRLAIGEERERWLDDDVMVIERSGNGKTPNLGNYGLLAIFNDGGKNEARTVTVETDFPPRTRLQAIAASDLAQEIIVVDANGRAKITAPPGGFRWYTRESFKPLPRAIAPPQRATTQVWEFADDLDTGRLGGNGVGKEKRIAIRVGANKEVVATLFGLSVGAGTTVLELRDATTNALVGSATGKRGRVPITLTTNARRAENYHVVVRVSGAATTGKLRITYTAPLR